MWLHTRRVSRSTLGETVPVRRSRGISGFALAPCASTYWVALVLACAAVSLTLAAPAVPRIAITVRVYQTAGLPTALEKQALAEAESVLRAGRVDVHWKPCTGRNSSPSCDAPPGPSELLLFVREGSPCQGPSETLGQGWVVPGAGGVLATVNVNCVLWLATAAGTDVAILLGRVAAHELGHLMMRTSAHPGRGLMRPHWTAEEIQRDRPADWAFTSADVTAMRQPGTQN